MISDLSESDLASMLPNASPSDSLVTVGDTIVVRLHRQKTRARKAVVKAIISAENTSLSSILATKNFKGYVTVSFDDGSEGFVWPYKDWLYTLSWITSWSGDTSLETPLETAPTISPRLKRLLAHKKDVPAP